MNEHDALAVTAVRAVETSDAARTVWSEADRAWASRAAAEVVGERARPMVFLARRATLAMERLGERHAPLRKIVGALAWRGWVGVAVIGLAFVAGVAVDRIGGGQRINVLAPPVLALLVWNLVVYAWLLVTPVLRAGRGNDAFAGPLRRGIVHLAGGLGRLPRHDARSPLVSAIASFAGDWSQRASPLYYTRAARILHFAAATFAAGVIAGLYMRGLAFEYRATWESTFLDPSIVHRILSIVLAPGSLATGIPIPGPAEIEAMRSGAVAQSANAAPWLHLIAATVAIVVLVPRLLLAMSSWMLERYRAAHMKLPLDDPYFQRVLRGFRGGPVRVNVIPYSYNLAPPAQAGLQRIVNRIFGGSASMVCTSPVTYGGEDALPPGARPDGNGPVFALFNLQATPEPSVHIAFIDALKATAGTQSVIVLVDEAPFAARAEGDARRFDERRAAWHTLFTEHGSEPVFVNLDAPDLSGVETAIEMRLGGAK